MSYIKDIDSIPPPKVVSAISNDEVMYNMTVSDIEESHAEAYSTIKKEKTDIKNKKKKWNDGNRFACLKISYS